MARADAAPLGGRVILRRAAPRLLFELFVELLAVAAAVAFAAGALEVLR